MNTNIISTSILLISCASPAWAQPCAPYAPHKYPGHIAGVGIDDNYEAAKAKATADALQFLGATVTGDTTVSEDNNSTQMSSSSRVTTEAATKGIEVLATCVSDDSKNQVIVGFKKTLLHALLQERAMRRREAFSTTNSDNVISRLRRDEEADKEAWVLLGYPTANFPSLGAAKPKSQTPHSYQLEASGPIAELTLDALRKRLRQGGARLSDSGEIVVWTCVLNVGTPIGEAARFSGSCRLPAFDLNMEFSGMARPEDIPQRASDMILEKLLQAG